MFYFPLALRNVTQPFTPKGPSLQSFKLTRFSIDGTEIALRAPRHRSNGHDENISPKKSYSLRDLDRYMSHYRPKEDGWRSVSLIHKAWDFYGPWLAGKRASVTAHLSLLKPTEPNSNASFFHPRALEQGIADLLTYTWGDAISTIDGPEQYWFGPMGWRVESTFPCAAASFELRPNQAINSRDPRRYLVFPLADHYLVALTLNIQRERVWRKGKAQPESTDEWVDITPLKALVDAVIESVQINLSPEAEAQQHKALEGLADRSLTTTFPPLKWGGHPSSSADSITASARPPYSGISHSQ